MLQNKGDLGGKLLHTALLYRSAASLGVTAALTIGVTPESGEKEIPIKYTPQRGDVIRVLLTVEAECRWLHTVV